MKALRAMFVRLGGLFRRKQQETEMVEELRAHVDALADRNRASGMAPDEARYAALRAFGGVAQIAERARDERRSAWGEQVLQDLRYAMRSLRKTPGVTTVVILTLALGIGANTAVFSITNALLFRVLPVPDARQLALLTKPGAQIQDAADTFSYPQYERLRDDAQSLIGLAASASAGNTRALIVEGAAGSSPEAVIAREVSGNFFSVLGVSARIGRTLLVEDDNPRDSQPVVVLSHVFWQRRFEGSSSAIGKAIQLDGMTFTIVGVAPSGFAGLTLGGTDVWLPIQVSLRQDANQSESRLQSESPWLHLIGRLRPGVKSEQVRAELDGRFQRKVADLDPYFRMFGTRIDLQAGGLGAGVVKMQRFKPLLTFLTFVVGLVLLVACANVAGLLLARASRRQRELAMRSALGASRSRLVRQLLAESLLLAGVGGLLGLLFARVGVDVLASQTANVPDFTLNLHVLFFALLLAGGTGVLAGLTPAWRFSSFDLVSVLKLQFSSVTGSSSRLPGTALVVIQLAVSICLLFGTGLLVRTFQNLRNVDVGFKVENLAAFSLEFGPGETATPGLLTEILSSVEALPGVQSATWVESGLGLGDAGWNIAEIEGYTPARGERMRAHPTSAGPKIFETMGLPLVRGRTFDPGEYLPIDPPGRGWTAALVINESMARKFFPDADPIGRRLKTHGGQFTIVGVARDTKYVSLRDTGSFQLYVPFPRLIAPGMMSFRVRTNSEPMALAAGIRATVRRVKADARVVNIRTMKDFLAGTLAMERAVATFAGIFGIVALLLACMGLYGALAYNVAQRTREIGVRMALGATGRDVLALVAGQGVGLALLGCVIGVAASIALMYLVRGWLYGVTIVDPTTLIASVGVLTVVALMACYFPARRATKVDPMVALRAE